MYIDWHSKLSCYVRTYVLHLSLSLANFLVFIDKLENQDYSIIGLPCQRSAWDILWNIVFDESKRTSSMYLSLHGKYIQLWTYGTFLGFFSFSIKLFGRLQKRGRWLACCSSRAKDVSLDLFRQGHVSNDTNPL